MVSTLPAGALVAKDVIAMMMLTRLDHRVVAINPDHLAWVEATPDTTLCLHGDRKIIVRESMEEVIERFMEVQRKMGRGGLRLPDSIRPSTRPGSSSNAPVGLPSSAIVDPTTGGAQ